MQFQHRQHFRAAQFERAPAECRGIGDRAQHGMRDIKVVHYSGHRGIKPWDFIIDNWVAKENPKNQTVVKVPGGEDLVKVEKHDLNSFMLDHVLPNFDNCRLWCLQD